MPEDRHDASTRLAAYGTLRPGEPNHHQLAGLRGRWRAGTVRGRLVEEGWAAAHGYLALVIDPGGDAIEVGLFESADLPMHWDRLDAFEGDGYRRVVAPVETADWVVHASIYVAADPA